jgi:hypothetical protein
MVTVAHLPEMKESTRHAINLDDLAFSLHTLIVISRQREILAQMNTSMIKPLRIMGNRLSSFMEVYLAKQGKRDLFSDSEFFDACSHLSRMVGQREVISTLATLLCQANNQRQD